MIGKIFTYILIIFFLFSCTCKRYTRYFNKPIFSEGERYLFEISKGEEIIIGFPANQESLIGKYKLPNDSIGTGYIANLAFSKLKNDSIHSITIGKGAEFLAGKCKFRVLDVEPRVYFDTVKLKTSTKYIKFQLIELPHFCLCKNKKLKKLK